MLEKLRSQTKIILWVVVVGFVGFMFFDWGMNRIRPGSERAGLVGKVGRDRITTEEFRQEYRNQRSAYFQNNEASPTMQTDQEIADRTWETLVQRHLLLDEAERQELMPSNDEVLLELQNNPPAFIRSQPVFQTDSVFDQSKYLAALADPNTPLGFLEDYVRSNLPYQKLREYMAATVRITDEEAETFLRLLQEQARITYIQINPMSDVKEAIPEPGDEEVTRYYAEHQEDFRLPEKRTMMYVEIPKQPSAEDRIFARTKIEDAYALVEAQEPFDEIAKHYSDDASATKGGDLGWITPGNLPAPLDSVARTLAVGQASGIIETDKAFYIIRKDDERTEDGQEQWKISQITAILEASPVTIENIREDLYDFIDVAKSDKFETAAEERGLEVKVSPELPETQVAPFFGVSQSDADRVFGAHKGSVVGPVEGSRSIFAIMTAEVIPSRIPPLDEIKDYVKQSYTRSIRKEKAHELADQAMAAIDGGKTLEQVAAQMGLMVHETQPFTRMGFVPGIGRQNIIIATAFALDQGEVSRVIEYSDSYYIIRVDERVPLDESEIADNLASLRMSVIGSKQQAFLASWYEGIRNKVKIEDYRTLEPY
jgi:peptidyl-prolyl cis-trans isomerase D